MQEYLRRPYSARTEYPMFRDFVTDIAPALLLSLVLSAAGVIAAVELATTFAR
jgi:hypothetical protein